MEESFDKYEKMTFNLVKERVQRIRKFFTHGLFFIMAVIIYVAKTYFGAPFNFFPFLYLTETVMWCWTFVIGLQGIKLVIIENIFGTHWEKRQIQKVMQNDQNVQNKWK